MVVAVLDLTSNLVQDLQRSEGEKVVTGPMPSQYLPVIGHMATAHREIHHLLTRTTRRMAITVGMKLLPAIRPIWHLQSTRHSRSHMEE
jgi:hypothetical protein